MSPLPVALAILLTDALKIGIDLLQTQSAKVVLSALYHQVWLDISRVSGTFSDIPATGSKHQITRPDETNARPSIAGTNSF